MVRVRIGRSYLAHSRGVQQGPLAQYQDEYKRTMQAWADYLDGLKVGSKVVAIGRRAG